MSMERTRARSRTSCSNGVKAFREARGLVSRQSRRDCGRPRARPTRASIERSPSHGWRFRSSTRLPRADEVTRWRDRRLRGVFLAAARLHGVRGKDDRQSRQKAAFDILRALPVPVGWREGRVGDARLDRQVPSRRRTQTHEPRIFPAVRGPAGPGSRARRCAPAGACPASRRRHGRLENARRLVGRRATPRQGLDGRSEDGCTSCRRETPPGELPASRRDPRG